MTIEINQLIIRAVVTGAETGAAPTTRHSEAAPALREQDRSDLVADCVREVLRTLARAEER